MKILRARKRTLVCLLGLAVAIIVLHRSVWTPSAGAAPPAATTIKSSAAGPAVIKTRAAEFRISADGYVQAFLDRGGKLTTLDEPAGEGDYILSGGRQLGGFKLNLAKAKIGAAQGAIGKSGRRIEITGKGSGDAAGIEKTLAVEVFDNLPGVAVVRTTYKNTGSAAVALDKVVMQKHRISASAAWSFQGSAAVWGRDEILKLPEKFDQDNIVGGPGLKGNGGGIPVVSFWTDTSEIALGMAEALPMTASMPVKVLPDSRIEAYLSVAPEITLKPGDAYTSPSTFVAPIAGDYYEALQLWAKLVEAQNTWSVARPVAGSYEANWCGWGYESDFTPKQMLDIIPKLKELGFNWATIDLRWHDNYGDWMPREDTFPGNTLRRVVDAYHKEGIMMQAWYQPISAEDGVGKHSLPKPMTTARVTKEHPEWMIFDKEGKNARLISPVSTGAAMCPALPEVQAYHKMLIERFFKEFDFDGLKMDAVLTVPPCYNPAHHHKSPEDSIKGMGQVFKLIYDTARAIKPHSILQICPCGMVPAQAWVFFEDQAVTADPVGSIQVRRRVKMYKALLGPQAAVYGDHVELSGMRQRGGTPPAGWMPEGTDFASSVGTGAVVGTKFTWPTEPPRRREGRTPIVLTPERQVYWKKWIDIYNAKRLSSGTFKNLYAYGYSNPEAYAIEKNGKMYYAFYAIGQPKFQGEIELRGLPPGKYKIVDYVDNKELGTIDSAKPRLNVEFTHNLLVQADKL